MNPTRPPQPTETFPVAAFDCTCLEDEMRADRLCLDLLRQFAVAAAADGGVDPVAAGALARGADYFLRDFVIADRRDNLLRLPPGRVRQFAGNWYIVRNLEPNLVELSGILKGVAGFYRYLAARGLVSAATAARVGKECADLPYYRERIESFWAIAGDGYLAWDSACRLQD
jgi:hypothetical protein